MTQGKNSQNAIGKGPNPNRKIPEIIQGISKNYSLAGSYSVQIPTGRIPSVSEYGSCAKVPAVVLDYDSLANSDLISSKDVATWLCIKEETLASWRCRGSSQLIWKKIGRTIRYQVKDVRKFIKHGTCNPSIFQEVQG